MNCSLCNAPAIPQRLDEATSGNRSYVCGSVRLATHTRQSARCKEVAQIIRDLRVDDAIADHQHRRHFGKD